MKRKVFGGISYTVEEVGKRVSWLLLPAALPGVTAAGCPEAHCEAGGLEQEPCREKQRDDGTLPGVSRDKKPPPLPATDSPPNVDIRGASQEIGLQMLPFPARAPPSDVN